MNSPSSYQQKLAQYLKSGLSPKTLKKIKSMSDPLETGRFLYNAGYYKALLKFSMDNLKKNKQVPWPFVMKTLTDHNINLSKEAAKILLKSLLPKYREKHPWLSACGEWADISHEFQAFIQSQRKISQENISSTKPTVKTDLTVKSRQYIKQMDDPTNPNIKTTAKTNIIPEDDSPSEKQIDNSALYAKEATQPDITTPEDDSPSEKQIDNSALYAKEATQPDITTPEDDSPSEKQIDNSALYAKEATQPDVTTPEDDSPSEKQIDNSALYAKEAVQPDVTTPATQQSKPKEEALTPADAKPTEKTKQAGDSAIVLLDNPYAKVKTQEDIIADSNTSSEQTNYSLQMTHKTELSDNTLDSNHHSEQMNNAIPIIEETEPTENSALYKRERTQPDITPDMDEQQLLKQLEFVQAKGLMEEEKKITALLLKKNPKKYEQLDKELKMKKALHFLQEQQSSGRKRKPSHSPESHKVSEQISHRLVQLCGETVHLAEKHPKQAKDLAVFLYTMGWPEQAIKILEKNIQHTSDYWFYLNWLMEVKQYAVVLDMTNQLLTQFKPNSETLFPITYIKAQALYSLGEKEKAISYMSDIVKVRPEYKSARHFIEEWVEA